ncbi:MAG: putative ferric reductase [Desulforhopalus sp.]|jgi:predicted ferric reductase
MNEQTWKRGFLQVVVLFIGIPVLLYVTMDIPRRTLLKESLSLLSIFAFTLIIAQFFLTRCTRGMFGNNSVSGIIKIHKVLGYVFLPVLLVHPFLIVVPRYFEAGINSSDAFLTIITSVGNVGIVTGISAWSLMLLLGITSLLRKQLFANYKTWRVMHGLLSVLFIICASWHAINLGRHMTPLLCTYLIAGVTGGVCLLLKTNLPRRQAVQEQLYDTATR